MPWNAWLLLTTVLLATACASEISRPVIVPSLPSYTVEMQGLAGRELRLRFVMRDARLYAFRFRPDR